MELFAIVIFATYFIGILAVGIYAGRKGGQNTADDYFLAGRKLPWYAVGLSMIGSNVSTEHFIGMIGAAYIFGISPANWDLTSFLAMSLLIFLFLPYYLRKKLYTIPQFLENRFDKYTRTIFAILTIVHSVIVLLAGALYAGGLIFQVVFSKEGAADTANGQISVSLLLGIAIIAVTTGLYSIYGGLSSVVWTDVVQTVLLLAVGIYVSIVALNEAGGFSYVWSINEAADPSRVHLLLPFNHSFAPWTGVATLWITLGIWYNCANQFYIQRCFGARTEWDSRMGIVFAGFIKQFMPLITVFPGLIAFALLGPEMNRDKVFMTMVQNVLSPVMFVVVLTGMAAAIMSTVSSLLSSCSTIFTIDIYQRFFRPEASQKQLVYVGRIATAVTLLIGMFWAPVILFFGDGLFVYIQDMAVYFASPTAVIFLAGILWKGGTAAAANITLVGGMIVGIGLKIAEPMFGETCGDFVSPFLNRALISWLACLAIFIVVSLCTRSSNRDPAKLQQVEDATWTLASARLPEEERKRFTGIKSFWLWWGSALLLRLVTYILFV